jgi:hypothetical protein
MELPVVVLGDYRFAIGESGRCSEYEKWLRELIAATRVLVTKEETSRHSAGIRAALKRLVAHPRKGSLDRRTLPATPSTAPKPRPTL